VLDIVSFEASQVQPVPRIANGSRANFLAGLVTIDSGMIALIDLPNLLSAQIDGEEPATLEMQSAPAAKGQ
jgi:purine-binding chemotaxis protein CheW